jgi:hypothetical protein
VSGEDDSGGPLDVPTLEVLARRADTHPLVDRWMFEPDALSPRALVILLDVAQYPSAVESARLDVRWFEGGEYTFHYLESWRDDVWQCRWDRHPKPDEPRAHFHPPPEAARPVQPSGLDSEHHLGVLFAVLDWITERVEKLDQSTTSS